MLQFSEVRCKFLTEKIMDAHNFNFRPDFPEKNR